MGRYSNVISRYEFPGPEVVILIIMFDSQGGQSIGFGLGCKAICGREALVKIPV